MFTIKPAGNLLAFLFLLSVQLLCSNVNAQNTDTTLKSLKIEGQLRPRFEIRDGAFRPLQKAEKPAVLISNRIRITVDYNYKGIFSLRLSPQSAGVWGQTNIVQGVEGGGNKLAFFEAWGKLQLAKQWNLTVGRQVISLDDERFFGELDWAQGARAHDAISVQYKKNKVDLRAYAAYNQNYKSLYGNNINNPSGNLYSTNDATPYKTMQTVWAGFQVGKKSQLSLLAANLGFQNAVSATNDTAVYYSQTFGGNYFFNHANVSGNFTAYYQAGKNSAGVSIRACLLAAYAGINFTKKWQAGAGSDFISGNNAGSTQSTNNVFTPYFHTGHKFYGAMDYYYVGNPHKNAGISDTYLKLNFAAKNGHAINMALHQFFTPNKVTDGLKQFKKNLGQEMDLMYSYKLNEVSKITGGYSFYLTTSTLNYLKNTLNAGKYQQWFWLSINFTPTFLKTNLKQ